MTILLTWEPTDPEWEYIQQQWPAELRKVRLSHVSDDELDALLPDVEIIVGYMRTVTTDLIQRATGLRLIHVLGHGVDGLFSPENLELLRERDIQVARSNPASENIAEFVVMKMIAISRRVVQMHNRLVMFGDWSTDLTLRRGEGVLGGELLDSTLGLVGYGNIAQEVHKRVQGFGMEVGALMRHPERPEAAKLDFVEPWEEIHRFLGRCDYVVLTLPLTPETTHLLNAKTIASMKDGAYVVNISRGRIIEEAALHDALASGKLAGAALDVFESEERGVKAGYPTPLPLHQYNVLLTPHYAGATAESRQRGLARVKSNIELWQRGEDPTTLAEYDRGF